MLVENPSMIFPRKYTGVALSLTLPVAVLSALSLVLACDPVAPQKKDEPKLRGDDEEDEDEAAGEDGQGSSDAQDDDSDDPSNTRSEEEQEESTGNESSDENDASSSETEEQGSTSGDADSSSSGPEGTEDKKTDPMPQFRFFATSQEGLLELASDKKRGFGGDLGGLAGADEICKKLALRGNPGDRKIWRAFLSATSDGQGKVVHAIERIGPGPWHDFNGRLLARNIQELLPGKDGRPAGADPQLAEMFSDELGRPISPDTNVVDNHDMLTGSDKRGRLPQGARKAETCNDWTSDSTKLGRPRIGHAWPRSPRSGREWIHDHSAGGCGKGIDTEKKGSNGTPTVGSGGGYGGFYCFALPDEAAGQ